MRDLFAPHGVEPSSSAATSFSRQSRPEEWLEYNERTLGPMVLARAGLEPQGKWDALHEDLLDLYRPHNMNSDGTFKAEGEYLVTTARVPEA